MVCLVLTFERTTKEKAKPTEEIFCVCFFSSRSLKQFAIVIIIVSSLFSVSFFLVSFGFVNV